MKTLKYGFHPMNFKTIVCLEEWTIVCLNSPLITSHRDIHCQVENIALPFFGTSICLLYLFFLSDSLADSCRCGKTFNHPNSEELLMCIRIGHPVYGDWHIQIRDVAHSNSAVSSLINSVGMAKLRLSFLSF
jgi:hypothetical protein